MAEQNVMPVEFWSSVEYATFQKGLIHALGAAGWKARDRFQVTQADYWGARSRWERLSLRARTYGVYPLSLAIRYGVARRTSIGVVCTNTFYAPLVAACSARRRSTRLVHWVFDLFPDVLLLAGVIRAGGWQERLLRKMVRTTFDRAAVNIFLGERLREYAVSRFGPIPRSVVIPVGCDARPFADARPETAAVGEPLRILYCGNYGRMHEVDTIVSLLQGGVPADSAFVFRGNGPSFRCLEAVAGPGVHLGGNLEEAEWTREMRRAEVALVTMKAGSEGVVMPSKTYSALAAGQAVLAVCPKRSDLAETIEKHQCGWCVEPGDVAGLRALVERLAGDRAGVLLRRKNAWQAGQTVFDQKALAGQWTSVFSQLMEPKNGS